MWYVLKLRRWRKQKNFLFSLSGNINIDVIRVIGEMCKEERLWIVKVSVNAYYRDRADVSIWKKKGFLNFPKYSFPIDINSDFRSFYI